MWVKSRGDPEQKPADLDSRSFEKSMSSVQLLGQINYVAYGILIS